MKQIKKLVVGMCFLSFTIAKAQLSGTLTVPGTYTSIAAAINAVNTLGVSGPLTFNISAGYTEIAPAGGYTLTATGTLANPIIFRKNGVGVNPLIIAYAGGTGTPGTAAQDGIFSLIGSDYVTIDGINLIDQNTVNPDIMEYGYGLFKASATDGCQNNIIKNCLITLNRENNASGTAPAVDGSRGINVVNSLYTSQTTVLTITSAAGSNSNNQFFTNTIDNCNIGIALIGFADITPFTFADYGNNVGGASSVTGNIIRNFGGATLASNPSAAVRTLAQYNVNVSYNTINNNNGAGVNHTSTLRGIYLNTAVSANSSVNNNTLTLQFGGTTSQVSVIENISGATAASNTISISNNLITNCTNSLTTTGLFYGIYNSSASSSDLVITNNTFTNNTSNATTGATYLIYNNGAVANNLNISNNNLSHSYTGAAAYTGIMYNIYNSAGSILTTANINNNIFSSYNHVNFTGTGSLYFVYNLASCLNLSINSNLFNGLTFNHSGAQYYMYNSSSTQSVLTVSSNSITNITRNAAAGTMYCYYAGSSSLPTSTQTFSNNLFSNITGTISGTGSFYGLYTSDGAASPYPKKSVTNNIISNINYNSTGLFYGLYISYLGDGSTSSGSTISNNKLDNITVGGSTFYGLYNSGTASPTYPLTVSQNTVSNITSNGLASTIYASYTGGAAGGTNFFKNKVYNITSNGTTGTVYGLYATTSPTTTIYNNIIGNLYTPNTTGDSKVNGIYIGGGTNINVYFNTVYIPAATTSTSTLFGSNAIYASTIPTVDLRNNIFVNLSTPVGLGYASAYRRSTATLTSYASTSNNNLFYAGIPSANNLIYFDGTTGQSILSAYKVVVAPMDGVSVTENSPFISTVGSAANFLNINTVIGTQIESGAQPIVGITSDYIGTIRNISTPDIGAWEGSFTSVSCAPPTSVAVNSVSQTSLNATWSVPLSGSPVNYFYELRTTGAAGSGTLGLVTTGTITAPTTSVNITGLTELTGYYFYVLGNCGSGSLSMWAAPATFTTLPYCPVSSTVTISSITPISAVSSWTAVGVVPKWDVYFGPSTTVPSATTVATATTAVNSYTLTSLTPSTNYSVYVRAVCSSSYSSIWTVVATFTTPCLPPDVLTTLGNTRCGTGATTLVATTSASATLQWYAAPIGGLAIGTGSTLTTPTISATTNYYVSSVGGLTTAFFGNPSTTGSQGTNTGYAGYLKFDAFTNFTLNSVVLYPYSAVSGPGTVVIALESSTGVTLQTATVSVISYPTAVAQTVPLNFIITPGTDYRLRAISYSGVTAMYRDYTGIIFPYTLPGVASITNGSLAGYYYYFYNWSVSIGCESPRTMVTATVNPIPVVTASSSSSIVCYGTSAVLSVSTTATTYTWNTGATTMTTTVSPSVTTIYTVTVTNTTSCAASSTVSINVNPSPTLSVTSGTICAGNSFTMVASGATTYTYSSGSAIVTPTANASYSVTGTNTLGCISNIAAISNVTVNANPNVTATTTNSVICFGEFATLTASTSATSYTWNTGATTLSTSVSPSVTTTYSINVTNANGCNGNSNVIVTVNACVGLNELVSETVSVFPNPNTGVLNIALPASISQNSTLEIYDAIGKLVVKQTLTNELNSVNISNLDNGIYLFKILNNTNSVKIGKLVKQ